MLKNKDSYFEVLLNKIGTNLMSICPLCFDGLFAIEVGHFALNIFWINSLFRL